MPAIRQCIGEVEKTVTAVKQHGKGKKKENPIRKRNCKVSNYLEQLNVQVQFYNTARDTITPKVKKMVAMESLIFLQSLVNILWYQ